MFILVKQTKKLLPYVLLLQISLDNTRQILRSAEPKLDPKYVEFPLFWS